MVANRIPAGLLIYLERELSLGMPFSAILRLCRDTPTSLVVYHRGLDGAAVFRIGDRAMKTIALAVVIIVLATSGSSAICQPKVGDAAPAIDLMKWVNLDGAPNPTIDGVRGKVVVIEFWGTW